MRLPRSIAGWTMAVFGVLAIVMGASGLISPDSRLSSLGFEVIPDGGRASGDYTRVFLMASSMASFNMGVYYLVSVWTEWRAFYFFTVPFRLVTFTVFTLMVVTGVGPGGFIVVPVVEAAGAVATGIGLWLDRRRRVFSNP